MLTKLNIGGNQIRDKGANYLIDVLQQRTIVNSILFTHVSLVTISRFLYRNSRTSAVAIIKLKRMWKRLLPMLQKAQR